MRLLLTPVLVAAAVLTSALPASAATAVDTTGTTYSADPVRIAMTFPVAGPTSYSDSFLSCRSGCGRKHMGQDLMGAKMTPLVAAFDGVVSSLKRETKVGDGNYLVLTGDNGWSALYLHVNNDTPGTDDGRGTADWAFPRGIEVGTRVLAGQLVAWRGDSGNAESTGPHLHFELRKGDGWGGVVYNAFPSLRSARRLGHPVASGPHPDQSLVRTSSGAYFVLDGSTKHPVSAGGLDANALNRRAAVVVSGQELRLYRTAGLLPVRPGALVRDPAGALWRVTDTGRYATVALPGQRVATVAARDIAGLPVVDAPALPSAGMLVRWASGLYVVGADGMLHAADRYVLASWGLTAADATDWPTAVGAAAARTRRLTDPVPTDLPTDVPTDLPTDVPTPEPPAPADPQVGAPLGVRDGTLVVISAVGPAVVTGGVVRRIWDRREEIAYGYVGKPRVLVPSRILAGLPTGEIAGPAPRTGWR